MQDVKQISFTDITVDKGKNGFYVSCRGHIGSELVPFTIPSTEAFNDYDFDFFERAFYMIREEK